MSRMEKLMEFLQVSPDDSFLNHALALEYIKEGNINVAIDIFNKLLARDPGYIGSYYHLGKSLENSGRIDEAIIIYQTGMGECKKVNDKHAYSELEAALDELT